MKIKLLSIHSAHNYGSVLQAYALLNILKRYDKNVEIIDYRPQYFQCQYDLFSLNFYKQHKSVLKKTFYFVYRIVFIYQRYIKYKKFNNFINQNMNLSLDKYKTFEEINNGKIEADVFICGSDQIWNTDLTNGFDKSYFLDFVKSGKRVSYAASIGRGSIDKKYLNKYVETLKKFYAVSIREETNLKELKQYGIDNIKVVLDPTLLLDIQNYKMILQNSRLNIKERFILVYRLEDTKEFNDIVHFVQSYLNLKIISLNKKRSYKNEKNLTTCGPEDFLYLFNRADFIITNSFHGTVFSILFEKRNIIVPNTIKPYRMIDLMKKLEISERIITNKTEITEHLLNEFPDYQTANELLRLEKEKSIRFLEKALEVQ